MRPRKSRAQARRRALGLEPKPDPIKQAVGDVASAVRDGLIAKEDSAVVYAAARITRLRGQQLQPLARARLAITNMSPAAVATIAALMRDVRQKGEVRLAAAKTIGEWAGVPLPDGLGRVDDVPPGELVRLVSLMNQELEERAKARAAATIEGESTELP